MYGNIYHQYTPHVSIYISYMDPMGFEVFDFESRNARSERFAAMFAAQKNKPLLCQIHGLGLLDVEHHDLRGVGCPPGPRSAMCMDT